MAMVTTHTEGRVVTHSDDGQLPITVVQLPARDAAAPATPPAAPVPAAPSVEPRGATTKTPAAKKPKGKAAKRR